MPSELPGPEQARPRADPSAEQPPRPAVPEKLDHYRYIDALRGVAFLGVLTVHVRWAFPIIPLHTLAQAGMYGVQLFFLLSAVTLMRSMSLRGGREAHPTRNFFLRRLFRIAPLFWFGLILYSFIGYKGQELKVPNGLHAWHYVTTFLFLHGWTPSSINSVVPGGWSIAVEMTFYAVLPSLARWITGTRRAWIAFGVALVPALVLPPLLEDRVRGWLPANEGYNVADFFTLWFPAQLPVFLLGMAVYYLLRDPRVTRFLAVPGRPASLLAGAGVYLLGLTRLLHVLVHLPFQVLYSAGFAAIILALAARPFPWVVNRAVCALGTISYSCYLTHFAALDLARRFLEPHYFAGLPEQAGLLVHFVVLWGVTLLLTVLMSTLTYWLIEKPGIRLGSRLIRRGETGAVSSTTLGAVAPGDIMAMPRPGN